MNVLPIKRGSLEEIDLVHFGQIRALVVIDDAVVLQVGFVAHQNDLDFLGRFLLDLFEPPVHILETLFVRDRVGDDDPVRPYRLTAFILGSPFFDKIFKVFKEN